MRSKKHEKEIQAWTLHALNLEKNQFLVVENNFAALWVQNKLIVDKTKNANVHKTKIIVKIAKERRENRVWTENKFIQEKSKLCKGLMNFINHASWSA